MILHTVSLRSVTRVGTTEHRIVPRSVSFFRKNCAVLQVNVSDGVQIVNYPTQIPHNADNIVALQQYRPPLILHAISTDSMIDRLYILQ